MKWTDKKIQLLGHSTIKTSHKQNICENQQVCRSTRQMKSIKIYKKKIVRKGKKNCSVWFTLK